MRGPLALSTMAIALLAVDSVCERKSDIFEGGLFRVRCTVSIIIIHPSIYGLAVGRFRHLGENLGMIPSGPTFPLPALIDLTPVQL